MIGAIGVSNVDGAYLAEAIELAPIAVVQNEYSLLVRDAEREVIPLCVEHGIEFEAFSPLAGGWLTGKYTRDTPFAEGSRMTLRPGPYAAFVRDEIFDSLEELARLGDPTALVARVDPRESATSRPSSSARGVLRTSNPSGRRSSWRSTATS